MSDAESLLDLIEDAVVSQAAATSAGGRVAMTTCCSSSTASLRAEIRDAGPAASDHPSTWCMRT